MSKIIVAGGGHGGIVAAALLAKGGLDVTVYEKNKREDMGYDWTDIFNRHSLKAAGMDMPPEDKYSVKTDVTFYGPSERNPFVQRSPKNQPEIKMERKDIYDHIIAYAEQYGVKFEYGVTVKSAECLGNRVVGINTDKGTVYGDLIIDACGCNSPVRRSLPYSCGIQREMGPYEKFYCYRAFYNRINKDYPAEEFKLTLFPHGIHGIGWVMAEGEWADVLVGKFEPFQKGEVKEFVDYLRTINPIIGKKKVRGGQYAEIPVRQSLAVMTADGYAAIGDSAFMTIPLLGSGMANAFKAAAILADVVLKDEAKAYSRETLWEYQYTYYKKVTNTCAPLAALNNLLVNITPEQIDGLFECDVEAVRQKISKLNKFTEKDQVKDFLEILLILKNASKDRALKAELSTSFKKIAKLSLLISQMPKTYSENEVLSWAQKYNRIFKL